MARAKYSDVLKSDEGQRIFALWKDRPKKISLKIEPLINWLIWRKQQKLANQFSADDFGAVQVGNSKDINWIRTDKLFVTVLSKSCSPNQFEEKLQDAIKASFPSPHRLLLTKMRTEINLRGLVAEAAILGSRHIQTEWLNDFLKPNQTDTRAVIHNAISRHWEALGDQLRSTLNGFAEQLHQIFSPLGVEDLMAKCGLDKADIGTVETLKYFNCFSSTKPIDRSHLTTGHVFRINTSDEESEEFWVCLSPACDMVPGRRKGDCIPFTAVRLYESTDNNAIKNATKNIFLFLKIDNEVKSFSIYKDGNMTANPDLEQMFAHNKGRFNENNELSVASIVEETGSLDVNSFNVTVVAQLRYEYALYLLQRVGAYLSRPGLGMNFKGRSA
jgi:hypothetical protein